MRNLPLLIVASFSLALALCARADDPQITTTGTATIHVVPDQAVYYVTIVAVDADITKACATNEADGAKLVKALKAAGIADADIATNFIDIAPHYREVAQGERPERDGFQATRNYSATLHDLKQTINVFNAIVQAGVNAMPSVELEVSNTRPYRDQARAMAAQAALEKANALAKPLNCTVGKPRNIVEGNASRYFGQLESNAGGSSNDRPTPDTPESTPIGRIEIQATVTVTFDLK